MGVRDENRRECPPTGLCKYAWISIMPRSPLLTSNSMALIQRRVKGASPGARRANFHFNSKILGRGRVIANDSHSGSLTVVTIRKKNRYVILEARHACFVICSGSLEIAGSIGINHSKVRVVRCSSWGSSVIAELIRAMKWFGKVALMGLVTLASLVWMDVWIYVHIDPNNLYVETTWHHDNILPSLTPSCTCCIDDRVMV